MNISHEVKTRRREVMKMLFEKDMTITEIAKSLKISERTINSDLHFYAEKEMVFSYRSGRMTMWTTDEAKVLDRSISMEQLKTMILNLLANGMAMTPTGISHGLPTAIKSTAYNAAIASLYGEGRLKRNMLRGKACNYEYLLAERSPLDQIFAPYPAFPPEMLSDPVQHHETEHPMAALTNKPRVYVSGSSLEAFF